MPFADRADAGRRLAMVLQRLKHDDVVVLGLPRGGVPVAFEVARALGAPLDVILVRKVGVPFQPELAMGAIGEDGVRILDPDVLRMTGITEAEFTGVERRERSELDRRAVQFRGNRPRVPLEGRTAVVVDDGIATGSTALAALQVAKAHGAARVILAVPVAPRSTLARLAEAADEVVCLESPDPFFAVGQWYRNFSQTSDEEVVTLLRTAGHGRVAATFTADGSDDPPIRDDDVDVQAGRVSLSGHLFMPEVCVGLVVFAHGSGSSRHSPRNRYVASVLNDAGLGTLLVDLLTRKEEVDRSKVFDIDLLAQRLKEVTGWLRSQPDLGTSAIGFFGASTGAGAALMAAAGPGSDIAAVVSRGGRPDLAGSELHHVTAPTLLIVGGNDDVVLDLNRTSLERLASVKELTVVPGATHLFEEPGALETVASLARDWFLRYLVQPTG
ncbi:MAG TPA: phosphoribosyltransferase [Acidimicrobiales bacterium]|nr:phosphoribosyltransferase [Acidimicrobiales bacterium]